MVLPEEGGLFQGFEGGDVEFLGEEGNLVELGDGKFIRLDLLTFQQFDELVLVIIEEVEDEASSLFELYQNALPFAQVPPLDDVDDLHQRPVLLDWLVLSQNEGTELQMRVFLVGRQILEPKSCNNYFSFSFSIDRKPFRLELCLIHST